MKPYLIPILLVFLVSSAFSTAVITEMKAEPSQNMIILQWKTSQEENVSKFVIERSIDNRNFVEIGETAARGPGFQYKYEDSKVGRVDGLFYYRLKIVNTDGTFQNTDSLPVIPNISNIVRTWGSIKALFR